MAKARCNHGVRWYWDCPWCKTEADQQAYAEAASLGGGRYPFWRNLTREQAQAEVEREAKCVLIRQLMDTAMDEMFHA